MPVVNGGAVFIGRGKEQNCGYSRNAAVHYALRLTIVYRFYMLSATDHLPGSALVAPSRATFGGYRCG